MLKGLAFEFKIIKKLFLEILKSPNKDFVWTKLRSILKMLIVGIFLDTNNNKYISENVKAYGQLN